MERPALVVGLGVYARELAGELIEEAREAGLPRMETEDLRDDPGRVARRRDATSRRPPRTGSCSPLAAGPLHRGPARRLRAHAPARPAADRQRRAGEPAAGGGGERVARRGRGGRAASCPRGSGTPAARRCSRASRARQGAERRRQAGAVGVRVRARSCSTPCRATERGGGPTRRADVVREALAPRLRRSPIGTYRVLAQRAPSRACRWGSTGSRAIASSSCGRCAEPIVKPRKIQIFSALRRVTAVGAVAGRA